MRLLGVVRSSDPPLRCLVYELMPGGSVEQQLDSKVCVRACVSLLLLQLLWSAKW